MSTVLGEDQKQWRMRMQRYILAHVYRPLLWTGSVTIPRDVKLPDSDNQLTPSAAVSENAPVR